MSPPQINPTPTRRFNPIEVLGRFNNVEKRGKKGKGRKRGRKGDEQRNQATLESERSRKKIEKEKMKVEKQVLPTYSPTSFLMLEVSKALDS